MRRGLARSRDQAAQLIGEGLVRVGGRVATKPATAVEPGDPLVVTAAPGPAYASRGGFKLAGALATFGYSPLGLRALDAGASTGGFTDVLLRGGASTVIAVDVGYGQLHWALQGDPRVSVMDRTNVRSLSAEHIGGPVDLVVADLSFIPLARVLPALSSCATSEGDLILMVKPQFEVGRARLPAGGVVRDADARAGAVTDVATAAWGLGWGVRGVTASPLPGPSGNVEYFLWLRRDAPEGNACDVQQAVREGPQ